MTTITLPPILDKLPERLVDLYPDLFPDGSAAQAAVDGMVEYLDSCARRPPGDGPFSPTPAVDKAWHEFILCTRPYRDWCMETFGRLIEHVPHWPTRSGTSRCDPICDSCSEKAKAGCRDRCGGCQGCSDGAVEARSFCDPMPNPPTCDSIVGPASTRANCDTVPDCADCTMETS